MKQITVNPQESVEDDFVLSASSFCRPGATANCPELCGSPEKAAQVAPTEVTLRNKGGTIAQGVADWYYARLQGTMTLPHALLGVFKACLNTQEKQKLGLSPKLGLTSNDAALLAGQGLILEAANGKPASVPEDAKRIIRASIQVRVDDKEKQEVTLALRKPYEIASEEP